MKFSELRGDSDTEFNYALPSVNCLLYAFFGYLSTIYRVLFCFETRSPVVQPGLRLIILQHQSSEFEDYNCGLPQPAPFTIFLVFNY